MPYDLLWGSGLPLLLILLAVVWGIVLVDMVGRRCGQAYSRVSKAEQRASTLLAEGDRARAHVRRRRRDRLLHHVAQVAGHRHAALAGHHGGFDGEQLAADVGPGEPGDDADQVLVL